MPALPPADHVLLVKLVGTVGTMPYNNVFHVQYSGVAPGVPELNAFSTSFLNAYSTAFGGQLPNSVTYGTVTSTDLSNASAAQGSASLGGVGSRTGTSLMNQVAACITWKINNRYRGGHPRTYLPAGVQADTNQGHLWTDTFVSSLDTAAGTFRTAVNAIVLSGSAVNMICLARYRNKILLTTPLPFTITGHLVDHRIDTQRKRLGRDVAA
jgi:hypothetical protein